MSEPTDRQAGEPPVEEEIGDAQRALVEAEERLARVAADLQNTKRRYEQDVARARRRHRGEMLAEWLPVVENIERAALHGDSPEQTLRDGLVAIHRQAREALERIGVERIETVGRPFDPQVHEAVARADGPAGQVVEEISPGWRDADGSVIQAARVVVGT